MNSLKIVFFGSFQHYSVIVLDSLVKHFHVVAVVTTPPKPQGRHMQLQKTQVQLYAEKNSIPVFPLETLEEIPKLVKRVTRAGESHSRGPLVGGYGAGERQDPFDLRPDFLVVAGYGKLIPDIWLSYPKILPINMHPSLLPHYRGAFPAEWAIMRGESKTGVSLVTMTSEFDKGQIVAQEKINIENNDTRETLYAKLYSLGAKLLIDTLAPLTKGEIKPKPQPPGEYFYARKITKDDGFVPWEIIKAAIDGKNTAQAKRIERAVRALAGWPGVWTEIRKKRLKILSCHLSPTCQLILDTVQLEGKNPTTFTQLQKNQTDLLTR